MKKILIALDYDKTAQKVAEKGFLLAKSLGAEVVLLHVLADMVYYTSRDYSPITGFEGYMEMGPLQSVNIEGLKNDTIKYLDKIKQHLGDDSVQTMVKEGEFAESILEAADEVHADVIVLGSHSRKWLENIVMGSVSEKVLRSTSVPLFIVPTRKRD